MLDIPFSERFGNGLGIKAVDDPGAVVNNDQRYDIAVKLVAPLPIPAVLFLDIACLESDGTCGEKPFRPGAVASAVGHVDHYPLWRWMEQVRRAGQNCLCGKRKRTSNHDQGQEQAVYDGKSQHLLFT